MPGWGFVALGLCWTSPAAATETVTGWLQEPGVRLLVVRAAGDGLRWRQFPRSPGLRVRVLTPCPGTANAVCGPDGAPYRHLRLHPGRAAVWTWQGERILDNVDANEVMAALKTHLGPKPRVWIEAEDRTRRQALVTALNASGYWTVTHRISDLNAVRTADLPTGPLDLCPDRRLPTLGLLRVRDERAEWIDIERRCRSVAASGGDGQAMAAALLAEWRNTQAPIGSEPATQAEPAALPPATARSRPTGPTAPVALANPAARPNRRGSNGGPAARLIDRHLQQAIAKSHADLDLLERTSNARLIAAVRRWIGVRYQRDGDTAQGIDDFNLMRALYRDAYNLELHGEPLDWLQVYTKVPVDEARPEASVRVGDLLFKVALSYRPREVLLYLGSGKVVTASDVKGVQVGDVPRNLPASFYLVARRPSRLVRGR